MSGRSGCKHHAAAANAGCSSVGLTPVITGPLMIHHLPCHSDPCFAKQIQSNNQSADSLAKASCSILMSKMFPCSLGIVGPISGEEEEEGASSEGL